jgi:N-acyl-D-aspartate/D-glutamate deacylase
MSHDLIIRNGTVVDGTGAEPRRADVAVDGDRITAIGVLPDDAGTREIDAAGLTVTPGFIDLHTHLDAQVGWDPMMTPTSWHGVTTVLMGNCGVTFAPVAPQSRNYLAEMMESVEDIPRKAIIDGLPWDWETYPQYLDSVQRMDPALNVVGMVGHCAVRYHVMGERSMTDEAPTAEELDAMRAITAASIAGGAVGYSTSRILLHEVPDGRKVPGTFSAIDEYLAIADGMNDAGGGIFQAVLDFETKAGHELELLQAMAGRAGDVLFSGGPGNGSSGDNGLGAVEFFDRFLTETNETAGRITSLTATRPGGILMGLAQVTPVAGSRWRRLMSLPTLEDRVGSLSDPAERAELLDEGRERGLWYDPQYIFPLGNDEHPDYSIENGRSLAELASATGQHPIELMVDRLLESEGRELFNVWFFNRNTAALAEYLELDGVCPGLGDSGAHAGQICDADAPTHYLSYWSRDRGRVPLAEAVNRLTGKPAAVLGLVDRGTLQAGHYADINVFDPMRLQSGYPTYVHDFPDGKGRLVVGSEGYAATLVNGALLSQEGALTGRRAGRVLREFARS